MFILRDFGFNFYICASYMLFKTFMVIHHWMFAKLLKSAFQFYFTESETLYWHHLWKQLQMLTEGYYQVFEQSRNVHLGHNISNYNTCFVKRPCLFSMINCLKFGIYPNSNISLTSSSWTSFYVSVVQSCSHYFLN